MSAIGHNSFEGNKLKSFISRAEKLMEERSSINDDLRGVFAEARSNGFDTRSMREVIKQRQLRPDERTEREHLRDTYFHAMGLDLV